MKLGLICFISPLLLIQNILGLKTITSANSSLNYGSVLRQNQQASVFNNGYARLLLMPYKAILVQVFSCTDIKINKLARQGNAVQLLVSMKGRFLCNKTPKISISSTFKDPKSSTKISVAGQELRVLNGTTNIAIKQDNTAIFGAREGYAIVNGKAYSSTLLAGQYIEKQPGKPMSKPAQAPLPLATNNGKIADKILICHDKANIIETEQKISIISNECSLVPQKIAFSIVNPIGEIKAYEIN